MYPDDISRLNHIIDAANEAVQFLGSMTREELSKDRKTLQAIIRSIEIIGEASSKLSSDFKGKNDKIPWGDIIGMRNWLSHGYFNVDTEHIWSTVKTDIPDLLSKLNELK